MIRQVALLGLALVATGCGLVGGAEEMGEIRTFVQVEPVHRGTLDRTLKLTGTVEGGREIDLLPEVPGKVVSLPFKVGQEVHEGDVLARLDLESLALQKRQADAAVRLAELALETAKRDFGRAETLHERGTLTDQQFEQARSGMAMAEQQVKQARAGQGLARYQIDSGILTAPFDGIVARVAVEEGAWFNPMAMSPMTGAGGLVSLVDLDTIKIDLQVADRDVTRVYVGMPARVEVDAMADLLPEDGLVATVDSVGMAADPVARTFPVRVVADNPDHAVRAGTHARVLLVLERVEDALYVPEEAILEGDDGTYVVTVEGDAAKRVPVEIGLRGDAGMEVRGALAADQPVVTSGHYGLVDGAPVEVER